MTEESERLAEAGSEPEPEPEPEAVAALEPEPEPESEPAELLINLEVQVPVATNDQLEEIAALEGRTKQDTATRILIGFTQRQYSIHKAQGRL